MKKILTVIGARPQFIKAGPVSKALKKYFKEIVVHTGQHYDYTMSDVFFKQLGLKKPDYNLGAGSGSHAAQTAKIMIGLEKILLKELPDLVLIYGDTNSTLAGAVTAAKLNIPVAHVEAGLRSYERGMPEEINRLVAGVLAKYLFAPTKTAFENLHIGDGYQKKYLVGDVMLDSTKLMQKNIRQDVLERLNVKKKQYLLSTVHRASNTDDKKRLSSIVGAFIASKEKIIFPVHPRTQKMLKKFGLLNRLKNSNVVLTEPLGYTEITALENGAKKIITDSGGVQKEAYFLKVPCITLRKETEWSETVSTGWNILAGTDKNKILSAIKTFRPKKRWKNYYGSGRAANKIAAMLNRELKR